MNVREFPEPVQHQLHQRVQCGRVVDLKGPELRSGVLLQVLIHGLQKGAAMLRLRHQSPMPR
jgi:hypothetical protein